MHYLHQTLPEPERPSNVPDKAQWLAGEGAGSWFFMTNKDNFFHIKRFSNQGKLECEGRFTLLGESEFKFEKPYKFIHLSHCQQVTIEQGRKTFKFNRVDSYHTW